MESINESLKNVAKVKETLKSFLENVENGIIETSGIKNAIILLEKTEELLAKM